MGEYNTLAEPVPGYCDKCKHVCRDTYWSEGSYEGGVRFERCSHCGSLLEDATPEQERDEAIERGKAAEGMLDEAVRLLGQAEEADGWTTPNEFLRRAAKVLTPAEAQARQKEGSDA